MSNRFRAASVASALLALAVAPATASATLTISYAPATGALVQGDGASDGVSVSNPFGEILFRPLGSGGADGGPTVMTGTLVAGPGCVAGTGSSPARPAGSVACSQSGSGLVTANLGGSNDRFAGIGTYPGDVFAFGEDGNDILSGAGGFDQLDGGPGDDRFEGDSGGGTDALLGRDGNDVLVANAFAASVDRFDGGAGIDIANYAARTSAVSLKATVGGTGANDDGGQNGAEGDGLENVETLIGGAGNDFLEFRTSSRTLQFGAGTRTIMGNGGADTVRAVAALRTSLDGGLGQDTVSGGTGPDSIFSREGEKDTITCGSSTDTLRPDLRDVSLSADCENIDQSDVREGPNVVLRTRVGRVDADGTMTVRLSCPRSVRTGCRGTLAARVDRSGTRFGRGEDYSLRRGRSTSVEVQLPAGQVARARRSGARVRVRSIERGEHGPKTTTRSLPARRG